MSSRYQEVALGLLHNRPLVLWVLAGFKREDSEYDKVAQRLQQYSNLEPVLTNILNGIFPTEAELNAPVVEYGNEPLGGEICHVLGNRSPDVPKALRRYPELIQASDDQFIEIIQRLWNDWVVLQKKWKKRRSKLLPVLEQFLEQFDEATNNGHESGSVTTTETLLQKYFLENVHPFDDSTFYWGKTIFCRRWYNCSFTSKFKSVQFTCQGNNLTVAIEIG